MKPQSFLAAAMLIYSILLGDTRCAGSFVVTRRPAAAAAFGVRRSAVEASRRRHFGDALDYQYMYCRARRREGSAPLSSDGRWALSMVGGGWGGGGGFGPAGGPPPPRSGPPPHRGHLRYEIASIRTPHDFLNFLAVDDRLCVVKVHAHWCRICKQFDLKYRKLANAESDRIDADRNVVVPGRVRFAEMEYTANEDLCKRLNATRLPHILIYRGASGTAGKLTSFQCGPSAFQRVVDTVNYYLGTPTHQEEGPLVVDGLARQPGVAQQGLAQQPGVAPKGTQGEASQQQREETWQEVQARIEREKVMEGAGLEVPDVIKEERVSAAEGETWQEVQARVERERKAREEEEVRIRSEDEARAAAAAAAADIAVRDEMFHRSLLAAKLALDAREKERAHKEQEAAAAKMLVEEERIRAEIEARAAAEEDARRIRQEEERIRNETEARAAVATKDEKFHRSMLAARLAVEAGERERLQQRAAEAAVKLEEEERIRKECEARAAAAAAAVAIAAIAAKDEKFHRSLLAARLALEAGERERLQQEAAGEETRILKENEARAGEAKRQESRVLAEKSKREADKKKEIASAAAEAMRRETQALSEKSKREAEEKKVAADAAKRKDPAAKKVALKLQADGQGLERKEGLNPLEGMLQSVARLFPGSRNEKLTRQGEMAEVSAKLDEDAQIRRDMQEDRSRMGSDLRAAMARIADKNEKFQRSLLKARLASEGSKRTRLQEDTMAEAAAKDEEEKRSRIAQKVDKETNENTRTEIEPRDGEEVEITEKNQLLGTKAQMPKTELLAEEAGAEQDILQVDVDAQARNAKLLASIKSARLMSDSARYFLTTSGFVSLTDDEDDHARATVHMREENARQKLEERAKRLGIAIPNNHEEEKDQ